jgi:hypothetical protein
LVVNIRRPIFSVEGTITLAKPVKPKDEPASEVGKKAGQGAPFAIDTEGGARTIVEQCVEIAKDATGGKSYVGSDIRSGQGAITTSGNVSDHSQNSARMAARDIGIHSIDLLVGPPSPLLDEACVEIGRAFGRKYQKGQTVIDTFEWHGYRVQIIWRTPKYGGHMGHIHVGARWNKSTQPGVTKLPGGGPLRTDPE